MTKLIHPVAGAVAIATIATFWLSTALSELFASHAVIASVKAAIPWGFMLLIPALAVAGGSGVILAKGRRVGLIEIREQIFDGEFKTGRAAVDDAEIPRAVAHAGGGDAEQLAERVACHSVIIAAWRDSIRSGRLGWS